MAAAAATLVWSIHPLRVESVAWVAERRDTISGVFWLLALLAYLRSADSGRTKLRSRGWYIASIGCLVLSLLGKAWGMTFFVTLVAVDWYPLERRAWAQKIPFALAGIVFGGVAWAGAARDAGHMIPLAEWGPWSRVLQAAYGLCFYPWKTIWPSGLTLMYELPDRRRPPGPRRSSSSRRLGGARVARAAVSRAARRGRRVCGHGRAGARLRAERTAGRRRSVRVSEQPAVQRARRRRRRRRAPPRARLRASPRRWPRSLVALGALTWRQTGIWRDSVTLWAHALDAGQSGYVVHLNYGAALRSIDRVDQAVAEYRLAIALRPTSGNAWYNLANGLKGQGKFDDAVPAYERAIEYSRWKVDPQVNLANLYYVRRQYADAIRLYREATATLDGGAPEQFAPEPYLYLGMALADSGDRDGARASARDRAAIPGDARARGDGVEKA